MNDAHRKLRLNHLISTDYGKKADFVRASGVSKARVSQMAGAKEPFGEEAARKLAQEIGLHEDWFNHTWPTPREERRGIVISSENPEKSIEITTGVDRPSTYGERLQQAMNLAQKDVEDVAAAIDIDIRNLSDVLSGKGGIERFLSTRANALAAKFLQIDPNWLALGDGVIRDKYKSEIIGGLSSEAIDIAVHFDLLKDKADRYKTYAAAMSIIMETIGSMTSKD